MLASSSTALAGRCVVSRPPAQGCRQLCPVARGGSPRQRAALGTQRCSAAPSKQRGPRRTASTVRDDSSRRDWEVVPINLHCRHGEASPELEAHVREQLTALLVGRLRGGEFVEAEGGVEAVDVRLMPTEARLEVHPRVLNTELHDTYLRQGAIKVLAQDVRGSGEAGMRVCFDAALVQLEGKLKRAHKAAPRKQDPRH